MLDFNIEKEDIRKPLPSFTKESAIEKIRLAEDGWNNQDPEKIATAYSLDSVWRNRDSFINGRAEIIDFLREKWQKEKLERATITRRAKQFRRNQFLTSADFLFLLLFSKKSRRNQFLK